jgi:hypothetical protein
MKVGDEPREGGGLDKKPVSAGALDLALTGVEAGAA